MLEHLRPYLTSTTILLTSLALYLLYIPIYAIYKARQIRRLGSHPPVITTYLPYGVDFMYHVVTMCLADRNYELWLGLFGKYGRGGWTLSLGKGNPVVLTADPENIKAILASQFKSYGKGERFRQDWHEFLGNGIFTTDGQLWQASRQLIRPQFVKDRLSDLDIFEQHIQLLLPQLNSEHDSLDLFMRYTLDAATHFLLGRSVESLVNPAAEFADAFYNVQHIQGIVARVTPLNWLLPRERMGFFRDLQKINNFVNTYIDEALALPQEELEKKTNHDEGYTFLHAIASQSRDRTVLRDQLVSILLAGRDTTACTLTWVIYELSVNPKIQAKLRQEIIDYVGLEGIPTYQNLKDMKYLQHILNETLRLYPVVPYNVRVALEDTTLPSGGGSDGQQPIGILKDTPIGYSTLVMQRRSDLYPPPSSNFPPVEKFVPERWDNWTPKVWTYIPFNGGPRLCVGQQFALTEMGYTLVRIFQKYERVENRSGGVHPGLHSDIVLQPSKPVKVAFVEGEKSG